MTWTPERRKEYQKEYLKKRKAACKARGICPNCEKNPAANGKTCCQDCLNDKKLTLQFGTAGPYRQLYAELFERQGGLCGICRNPMQRPVLDHCHKTLAVRGLLCSNCNNGLGQFKDSLELLSSALKYIENNAGIGIFMKRNKE